MWCIQHSSSLSSSNTFRVMSRIMVYKKIKVRPSLTLFSDLHKGVEWTMPAMIQMWITWFPKEVLRFYNALMKKEFCTLYLIVLKLTAAMSERFLGSSLLSLPFLLSPGRADSHCQVSEYSLLQTSSRVAAGSFQHSLSSVN